jgi:Zn ribbon nucleic-acid-binding protein
MKCPGQDTRYWKEGDIYLIKCPNCGHEIEFFKDDQTRICKECNHKFYNPQMDLGCLKYCKFAKKCEMKKEK